MAHSVVTLTVGASGTGKSYVRCARYIADEWMPNEQGIHYSNFPVVLSAMAEWCEAKHGIDPEETYRRVQMIPEAQLKLWQSGDSGPWDYFKDVDLSGCHIAIDEIHVYCGAKAKPAVKKAWQEWLGDIRHAGASVEFLTQHPKKMAKEIDWEAARRLTLSDLGDRRDPWFRIPLWEWYEMRAGLITREYEARVYQLEEREVAGKWKREEERSWVIDPLYFPLYKSYNKTREGGKEGAAKPREFEKRTRRGLCLWFLIRNWWRLSRVALIAGLIVWITMLGGSATVMRWYFVAWDSLKPVPTITKRPTGPSAVAAGPTGVPGGQAVSGDSPGLPEDLPVEGWRSLAQGQAREIERLTLEVETIRADLVKVQALSAQWQSRAEALEVEQRRAFEVVGITRDRATFRNGYSYGVGEIVDWGIYAGRTVEGIDYGTRTVRLDGGVVLRMARGMGGGLWDRATSAVGISKTGPGGSVPPAPGTTAAGDSAGGDGPANDDVNARYAP